VKAPACLHACLHACMHACLRAPMPARLPAELLNCHPRAPSTRAPSLHGLGSSALPRHQARVCATSMPSRRRSIPSPHWPSPYADLPDLHRLQPRTLQNDDDRRRLRGAGLLVADMVGLSL